MPRIIFAADNISIGQACGLGAHIGKKAYAIKIHELFDRHGPSAVRKLKDSGWEKVWDDVKIHDTPKAAHLRAKALVEAGVDIISVHAEGEIEMMMAAKDSGAITYAVTVLTSLDNAQTELLTGSSVSAAVLYRARLAKLAKIEGVVCSPQEVGMLAKRPELKGLTFVTPGIRAIGSDPHDQKRVDTVEAAVEAGSDRLVIGHDLRQAAEVAAAYRRIEQQVAAASTRIGGAVNKKT